MMPLPQFSPFSRAGHFIALSYNHVPGLLMANLSPILSNFYIGIMNGDAAILFQTTLIYKSKKPPAEPVVFYFAKKYYFF